MRLRVTESVAQKHLNDSKKPAGTSRTRVFFKNPDTWNRLQFVPSIDGSQGKELREEYKRMLVKAIRLAFTTTGDISSSDFKAAKRRAVEMTNKMVRNADWVKKAGCYNPHHGIRCHCTAGFVISGGIAYGFDIIAHTEET